MKPWQALSLTFVGILLVLALAFSRRGVRPEDLLACTNLYEAARSTRDTLAADDMVVHEHSTRAPRSALTSCGDLRRSGRL